MGQWRKAGYPCPDYPAIAEIFDWASDPDAGASIDGQVFRIALSDVPERKTDLVAGRYELPAERVGKTVAVKIIDMFGEEVLVALPRALILRGSARRL